MKSKLVEIILMYQLISVCIGENPCVEYTLIYMADGQRSSDFDSRNTEFISICDAYIDEATWYRFCNDAGNKLLEGPARPWYCGTQAPIWLNGTHPTGRSEKTVGVCAAYSSENICGWSGTVRIRKCNESGSEYFVYLLDVPPGCPLAYCVDAASRKQCIPPSVWRNDQLRCGVTEETTEHSTDPTTKFVTPSASATTTSASTERRSSTPTLDNYTTQPVSSGWRAWEAWSVCSKPCDYGFQSRRRTCRQLPCEGPGSVNRMCNKYNCQSLPEEKTRGIGLLFQWSVSAEDMMLTVVSNQPKIHDIIRKNINDICSQNVSICCGSQYNGALPLQKDFVQSGNIYPSQGSLTPRTDNTAYYRVIAIINDDVDREICKIQSRRIYRRQVESNPSFLPFNVMLMASVKSAHKILQETGLIVGAYTDPATVIEVASDSGVASCQPLSCVFPIVLCISVVVAAILIGGLLFAKKKQKQKFKSELDPSAPYLIPYPEPPHYEALPY